jgi:hypothetical protein
MLHIQNIMINQKNYSCVEVLEKESYLKIFKMIDHPRRSLKNPNTNFETIVFENEKHRTTDLLRYAEV